MDRWIKEAIYIREEQDGRQVNEQSRELHGDGDDGITAITAVMGLDFMTDTAVIARMGTAFTVVPR